VIAVHPKDALGRQGEQLAAELLERSGLRILDRNWRCADGEIDIVAADGRTLVICEVKTRSGTRFGSPLEAVSPRKHARLRRLAVRWVLAHSLLYDEIRIDIVGVLVVGPGTFSVEHIPGVG
jgi:putative endonuclease